MFPEGYFYIESYNNGFVLDVYDGKEKEGANIIIWPQKFEDSDNQLWIYKDNRLENKKSNLVIDVSLGTFKKNKRIVQKKASPDRQSQEWIFDKGFLISKEYPGLVMDIKGDTAKGSVQIVLLERIIDGEGLTQLWQFTPYKKIEQALDIAKNSIPLHKKESFGKPSAGYGAEIGCPPELKKLPENSAVVCDSNPTPTTDRQPAESNIQNSSLTQYESFYCEPTKTSQAPLPISQYAPVPSTTTDPSNTAMNSYTSPALPQPGHVPFPRQSNTPDNLGYLAHNDG